MAVALLTLQNLQCLSACDAWSSIFEHAWNICSPAITNSKPEAEIANRDRALGDFDLFLATAGWDLWEAYESTVPRTSTELVSWWNNQSDGKAILILDALSLREVPWIVEGASERGFTIHNAKATGAELPADTTPFAKALGFSQRSSLGNNGAGKAHKLTGAVTESTGMPWEDCSSCIKSERNWVFWHHWPDHRLHDHDDPGRGLNTLTREIHQHLTSNDFWNFVDRLATGRRLIITADHGYAASGLFPDSNKNQTEYLKTKFKSGRACEGNVGAGQWIPPIDMQLDTDHGEHLFVLGRRKWKSSGGYPTLTHGGLSVLEVAVPFVELSKKMK